jgi:putative Holliday junction resolvase
MPEATRIMALDVGERTIGIALTDPSRLIASPLSTIQRSDTDADMAALRRVVDGYDVSEIVVGLPRSLSGELGYQAEKTLNFVELLGAALHLPVHMWDERLSTVEVERVLRDGRVRHRRRVEVVDQMAAAVILQGYLACLRSAAVGDRGKAEEC